MNSSEHLNSATDQGLVHAALVRAGQTTPRFKPHPLAADFPPLEGEEFDALVKDIQEHKLRERVVLYENKILDGWNRFRACRKAGVDCHFKIFEGDDAAAAAYVLSANLHRRHLTAEQKRDLITKLLKADPQKSDRAIAGIVRADHKTVATVRNKKERTGEIPQLTKTVGKDGKKRAAHKIRSSRPPPKPKKSLGPTAVVLNPLSWSEASPGLRRKFISSVGLNKLVDAASPDEKAAYLAKACAARALPKMAERTEPMTAPADDGLDIPDYLRRT